MQGPLMQKVNDFFGRLKGSTLIAFGVGWAVVIIVALLLISGVIRLPGSGDPAPSAEATEEAETIQPTQATDDALVAATVTPASGSTQTDASQSDTTSESESTEASTPAGNSGLASLPWGDFGYGIAAHGLTLTEHTMGQIKDQLGLTWVKQQVRWDHFSVEEGQMDWSGYDFVVDEANKKGLKVMLSVVGAPNWSRSYFDENPEKAPPDDYADYAEFLGQLVDRYKGKVHAIEVWNEQNLDREWDTADGVDAEAYVELLRLSYQTIKGHDPSIIVISGALSPTGVDAFDPAVPGRQTALDDFVYLDRMIAAGFLAYADCVGVHHNGYNVPPDVEWDAGYNDPDAVFRGPFDNPHHSFSFKSTLWGYHDKIVEAGYNTPLCVTEFGWASSEGFDGTPPTFEFADDNTLAEQAAWDVLAFQLMRESGFVHLAFLWNLDYSYKDGQGATNNNAPYSITDLAGGPREPSYGAIGSMEKIP